jgi:precorrin-2 dehydrogenase
MEYPVFLDIRDRLCVVIGGGLVGRRKAQGLAGAGARVRLIEPQPLPEGTIVPGVEILQREFHSGDLRGAFLAFAATDDRAVNAAVAEEARRTAVLVNVVDAPEEGDFSLPARFSRGDLSVAVSTNGKSPAFAVLVKEFLAAAVGDEWRVFLEIAAAIRQKMLAQGCKSPAANEIFFRLLEKGLPNLIKYTDARGINSALKEIMGPGYALEDLGVSFSTRDD